MNEVEDIMCDQCIISPEFNFQINDRKSYLIIPATKLWLAVDLMTRALFPSVLSFCHRCFQNQQTVVRSVRHRLLPAIVAFLVNSLSKSLASVQYRITYPIQLRLVAGEEHHHQEMLEEEEQSDEDGIPERSVHCVVLAEPAAGVEMKADVVFVHGLHGGLDKTWRQGTWRHSGHKLNQRSPVVRSLSTGDMHVPPNDTSLKRTLSNIYSKIPRKVPRSIKTDECDANTSEEDCEDNEITYDDGEEYSNCWPQDWLPKDCPNVRVIAINYTTETLWTPLWQKKRVRTGLVDRSNEMIEELIKLRVGEKPIIWVGHSKGGLYIKQILVNACDKNGDQLLSSIFHQTKAIMFYSVPHKGSSVAHVTFPFLRRSIEVLEVQRNCDCVMELHRKFLEIIQNENNNARPEIFSFIETAFTLMGFMFMKIIPYESGDPDIGTKCDVPLDHREICKPAGRDCFLYLELVKLINRCLQKCEDYS